MYGKSISCISSNIVLCFVCLPLISADSRDWQRCGEVVRRNDKCDSDQRCHWHIMSGLIVHVSQFMFNMTCLVVPSSRISPYFWKVSDATVMWTPGINIWSVSGYVILQSYTCSLVIAMTAKAVCRLHIMTFLTRLMLLILYDGNQSQWSSLLTLVWSNVIVCIMLISKKVICWHVLTSYFVKGLSARCCLWAVTKMNEFRLLRVWVLFQAEFDIIYIIHIFGFWTV